MQRRACHKPAHMLITHISSFHVDKPASHHKSTSETLDAEDAEGDSPTSTPAEASSTTSAEATESATTTSGTASASVSRSDKSSTHSTDAPISEAAAAPTSPTAAPDEAPLITTGDGAETQTLPVPSPGIFDPSAQHAMKIVSLAASSTSKPSSSATATSSSESFLAAALDGLATNSLTASTSMGTASVPGSSMLSPPSALGTAMETASMTVDFGSLTSSIATSTLSLQTVFGAVVTPSDTSTSQIDSLSGIAQSSSGTDQSTSATSSSTFDIAALLGAANVASTVVIDGPSQTVTVLGYTGSSGFTPVFTRTGPASIAVTPVTSRPAKINRASRIPVIAAIGSVAGLAIICIAITIFHLIRRWRREHAFDPEDMGDLGFPPDYNPFLDGFREQEKAMAAAKRSSDDPPKESDPNRSPLPKRSPLPNHSPLPGEIPAYFMKDSPAHLRVANYVQGDASDSSAASPALSPKPWAPLQPRKSILKPPKPTRVAVSTEVVVEGDKYTPLPKRRSKKVPASDAKIDDGGKNNGDDKQLPPLNKVVRDYYSANPQHSPRAVAPADSLDSEKTVTNDAAYAGIMVADKEDPEPISLQRSKTTASSLYSTGSHELPPISLTDSSMSSLKHALTGFQVISDDEQSLSPSETPILRRALSLQSSSADSSTSEGSEEYAGSDYERLNDGSTREERAVRKVLRERRKKSLAIRAGLGEHSLHRSYTRLTLLQRK